MLVKIYKLLILFFLIIYYFIDRNLFNDFLFLVLVIFYFFNKNDKFKLNFLNYFINIISFIIFSILVEYYNLNKFLNLEIFIPFILIQMYNFISEKKRIFKSTKSI